MDKKRELRIALLVDAMRKSIGKVTKTKVRYWDRLTDAEQKVYLEIGEGLLTAVDSDRFQRLTARARADGTG